jgi:hypothetical protein
MEVGSQRHAPAALHPERDPYPFCRRLWGGGGHRAGVDG